MGTFNRILWILIALLLIAVGILGLLAGRDVFGPVVAAQTPGSSAFAFVVRPWLLAVDLWVIAAIVAVILGVLLLRSESNVGPPQSFPDFHLPRQQSAPGTTVIRSAALRHALQHDLEQIRGVQRVGISLLGKQLHPTLQLRLEVRGDRDVAVLRQAVQQSVDRFADTLGSSPEGGEVILSFTAPPKRVVA